MPRNSSLRALAARPLAHPRASLRAVTGGLLALNLVAAWFVFNPPGGSVAQLERDSAALRRQLQERQGAAQRLHAVTAKLEKARSEGDKFMAAYFLDRRSTYSTLVTEMQAAAKQAGIRERDQTFNFEPIEGSDTLAMLTINANYEGTYADLVQFINQLDRSPRLMIIEMLQAQPQQGSPALAIAVKLIAFVREEARP